MNRETLIGLALVGWFAALAIAETFSARDGRPSEGRDDGRLFANFGLTALNLLAGSLFSLVNVGSALIGNSFGITHQLHLPWAGALALLIIAQTFASYWVHRLMHRLPLLWRVHRVHHADSAVDVSTSLRHHPFELLLTVPVFALVNLLVGAPVSVVAAVQGLFVAGAIWEHADIELPERLERRMARLFVTPRLHRLHHSPDRGVHDSNYGNLIMIWDRLFGSMNDSKERAEVGLREQRPNRLFDQICSPLYAV